jgi:hypothetical protein
MDSMLSMKTVICGRDIRKFGILEHLGLLSEPSEPSIQRIFVDDGTLHLMDSRLSMKTVICGRERLGREARLASRAGPALSVQKCPDGVRIWLFRY